MKNNEDKILNEFFKKNAKKLRETTPVNPCIAKDDEWYNEDEWDEDFHKKEET